jgi:uncharacterized protein YlxW (UPF0749 family)
MKDINTLSPSILRSLLARVSEAASEANKAKEQLEEIYEASKDVERYEELVRDTEHDLAEGVRREKNGEESEFDLSVEDLQKDLADYKQSYAKYKAELATLIEKQFISASLDEVVGEAGRAYDYLNDKE